MDHQKWKLANQDKSTVTLLEVKLESDVRHTRSIGDDGNVDIGVAGGARICSQRRLSEDKLRDINDESGCDKEELTPAKNFTLKKLWEIFCTLKVQRMTCWNLIKTYDHNNSPSQRKNAPSISQTIQ